MFEWFAFALAWDAIWLICYVSKVCYNPTMETQSPDISDNYLFPRQT